MTLVAEPMSGAITEDRLLGGRVILRQPADGYRAAIDPVLLAAAAAPVPGWEVLDAGCGAGAALFSLAARCNRVSLTGLERDPAMAALARDAIALNHAEGRVQIMEGDIAAPPSRLLGVCDLVITNPPYAADGTQAPNAFRAAANHESDVDLATWIAGCLKCLKPKGRLVMIHRADRLSDVLTALNGATGDIHVLPIQPRSAERASRVIVDAGKQRRTPDTLLPAFILHGPDGAYTAAAQAILRDAMPLPMSP